MNKLLMKTIGIVSSLGSIYLNSAVVNMECGSNVNDPFLKTVPMPATLIVRQHHGMQTQSMQPS